MPNTPRAPEREGMSSKKLRVGEVVKIAVIAAVVNIAMGHLAGSKAP